MLNLTYVWELWITFLYAWSRYVETLKGRKRFLSKIKFGSRIEKSKAQRQAVNSICQVSVISFSSWWGRLLQNNSQYSCLRHFLFLHPSQGSAADIIKIAMIRIYSEIAIGFDSLDSSSSVTTKFQMLKDRCRILLQVKFI